MAPPPAHVGTADASAFLDDAPVSATPFAPVVPDNVLKGIGLIIASTLFFSAGDVAAKVMTETLPPLEVTWFRYLLFVALVLPLAFAVNGRQALVTSRPGLQLFRAGGVVLSSVLFIVGLKYLQPAEATAIGFLSPIFITALSIPLLGEKVGPHRWAAAGVGFLGVMLVVRPGSDAFQMAALFPIFTAAAWASAAVATRKMTAERPETTLAWTALAGFVSLSLAMAFVWQMPNPAELGLGILTGLFSTVGHWFVVKAYRLAPASVIAPFSYIQLVFAGAMGYLAFGVAPGPWTYAGGLVIAASGLYTAHRESERKSAAA